MFPGQNVNWELENKISQAIKDWEKEVTGQPVNDSTYGNDSEHIEGFVNGCNYCQIILSTVRKAHEFQLLSKTPLPAQSLLTSLLGITDFQTPCFTWEQNPLL